MTTGYKIFTHTYGSPVQGGEPIWDGAIPFDLPVVDVDDSEKYCAAGWNACRNVVTALQIAGLWKNGWPARLARVETLSPVIERGDLLRAATWTVTEWLPIEPAIRELSGAFKDHADDMAKEQIAWHQALARPKRDAAKVVADLKTALGARKLHWKRVQFASPSAAWAAYENGGWAVEAAWDVWGDRGARDARDVWGDWGARDAWGGRGARGARNAKCAWGARNAWGVKDWDPWDARDSDAWDARDAMVVQYASRMGWIKDRADYLTVGIRDAYMNGLGIALPVGANELGWAMMP